jgi:hypothetical protein
MKTRIEELKNQVIELIKEKVKGESLQVSITGDECFESVPLWVPHGSEMTDVYIDITISDTSIEFKVDGEGGGFIEDDPEPETFELSELTLHQLTFILSNI